MTTGCRVVDQINLKARYVVDSNGRLGDTYELVDEHGNDTTELCLAVFVMVQWRDDLSWSAVDLTGRLMQTQH